LLRAPSSTESVSKAMDRYTRRALSRKHYLDFGGVALTAPASITVRRLPNRHPHEALDFEFDGIRYTVGIGRFDDGALAEIFFNVPGKVGTDLETHTRGAAIAASLALQHRCPLDTLRGPLTRVGRGDFGSALSGVLDLLAAEMAVSE
jgi:hypothetical protein